jgi:hypothetical protein
MSTPQNMTSRYARNLLNNGRNNDFTIVDLQREHTMVDEVLIGYYYTVAITGGNGKKIIAVGATPTQAVTRCLEKHGVTFR